MSDAQRYFRLVAPPSFALAIGSIPYLARPGTTLLGSAAGWKFAVPVRLPALVAATLPDAAWAFAIAYTLSSLWRGPSAVARPAWIAAGFVLGVGWELAQAVELVPGTFDLRDLLASALAYGVGVWVGAGRRSSSECVQDVRRPDRREGADANTDVFVERNVR
jgi:hypothetical protein